MTACTPTEPLRVLVVDDCPDATASLALLLEAWGYPAHVTNDGPTALRLAAEHRVDVVLLDIGMPGMDGWEVARRVHQTPGQERTRLVVLSGHSDERSLRQSFEAGCHFHLTKPVEPRLLLELLRALEEECRHRVPSTAHGPAQ